MRHWLAAIVMALPLVAAQAVVREEAVTYRAGDTTMKGVIVHDDARSGKRPGILVVHEWWGITPHTRDEARRLAGLGYTAMVVDMYGDGKTADNPKDAGALVGSVMSDPAVMRARFNAAKNSLAAHGTVDPRRIGAIGFCFGGSVVLDMARSGAALVGVAAFHPGLEASVPASPGAVKAKVLVLVGADDPYAEAGLIAAFRKEMDAAKVDYRVIAYPGAMHSFTNPEATAKGRQFNLPIAYDAAADRQAKAEMTQFFAGLFGR